MIAQQAMRPSSETCLAAKLAKTGCPGRNCASSAGLGTENWKVCPLVLLRAVTMCVALFTETIEQQAGAAYAFAAAANIRAMTARILNALR